MSTTGLPLVGRSSASVSSGWYPGRGRAHVSAWEPAQEGDKPLPDVVKPLTLVLKERMLHAVPRLPRDNIAERRRLEDALLTLGAERERLTQQDSHNRQKIRELIAPAREAGITVRDIARLTGLSSQTLHTWIRDLMRPVPTVHYGPAGPPPETLEDAALRTIGDDPKREWMPSEVQAAIPAAWPNGSIDDVAAALETLVRSHLIWDAEHGDGYRLAPPT
jgi:hypothetical protein